MLFILRFKVKSGLTLSKVRPFTGNKLAATIHNKTRCYNFILSKQFNDAIGNKVIYMTTKTANNKINPAISIFIRIHF